MTVREILEEVISKVGQPYGYFNSKSEMKRVTIQVIGNALSEIHKIYEGCVPQKMRVKDGYTNGEQAEADNEARMWNGCRSKTLENMRRVR